MMIISRSLNCLFRYFPALVKVASGIAPRKNALAVAPSMAVDITTLSISKYLVLVEIVVI